MVNSSHKIFLNRKRGISTIVGGIIFLVLLTAGFSTFFVAMDVQSDTINAQRTISNSIIEKTQEQFSITAVTDDSNPWHLLDIQVKNEGTNPIQISNIWIINKSQVGLPAKSIPISSSDAYIPAGYGLSILETQRLTIDPSLIAGDSDLYDIKVISTLGTIKQTEINVGGSNYLLAELFTIPPDVRLNENVTLALRVTNVGPSEITGITPDQDFNPNGIEAGKETWLSVPEPILPVVSPVDLKPSESTIFSWTSTLTNSGTVGEKVKFTNSASGIETLTGFTVSSNPASDKMAVQDDLGGASGEDVVLKDHLFAQPGIFMIVPNTFGDNDLQAIWAITIANPTDAPMDINKITTSVLFAGANDNQWIFVDGCPRTNIAPTLNHWNCPNENQLVWFDGIGPTFDLQTVDPRSAYTFLVTVKPGSIQGAGGGLDSVVLHTAVFTSLGAFGQTSWATSMIDADEAIVNVYSSDLVDSIDPNDVEGSRVGINPGATERFRVVLGNLDTDAPAKFIRQGAKLIINIPKEWTLIEPLIGNSGFDNPVQINYFPDESSQIVATLSADLATGGKTITFDVVAPSPSCDKMYVMHVLANGMTGLDNPIGPVAETVLQVDVAGCP